MESLEEKIAELNNPKNRESVEQYAKTFVGVFFSNYGQCEVHYSAFKNAIHFVIDHEIGEIEEEHTTKQYFHDLVNLKLDMPTKGVTLKREGLIYANEQDKKKANEIKEKMQILTENYITKTRNMADYLRVAFKVTAKQLSIEEKQGIEINAIPKLVGYMNTIIFYRNLKKEPLYDKLKEQAITGNPHPIVPPLPLNSDLAYEITKSAKESDEERNKISVLCSWFSNGFIEFKQIGLDPKLENVIKGTNWLEYFDLKRYFGKIVQETPGLKEEIIEEGKKYGINFKF